MLLFRHCSIKTCAQWVWDRLKGPDGWAPELGEAEPLQTTELWGDNQGYYRVVNWGCMSPWLTEPFITAALMSKENKSGEMWCTHTHTHTEENKSWDISAPLGTLYKGRCYWNMLPSAHKWTLQWIASTVPYLLHEHLSLLPPWNISADFTGNKAVSSTEHWSSAQLAQLQPCMACEIFHWGFSLFFSSIKTITS